MTHKDDGIARLPNGLLISEEIRDKLLKQDWSKPRRIIDPNAFDPNTATSKDLEEKRWNGFRVNTFTNDVELWCMGRIGARRNVELVNKNPKLLADMHEEVFATAGTVIKIDVKINRKGRRRRKP